MWAVVNDQILDARKNLIYSFHTNICNNSWIFNHISQAILHQVPICHFTYGKNSRKYSNKLQKIALNSMISSFPILVQFANGSSLLLHFNKTEAFLISVSTSGSGKKTKTKQNTLCCMRSAASPRVH